jgi:hypothetical protein
MTKAKRPVFDADAKAVQSWDNEGGAPAPGDGSSVNEDTAAGEIAPKGDPVSGSRKVTSQTTWLATMIEKVTTIFRT